MKHTLILCFALSLTIACAEEEKSNTSTDATASDTTGDASECRPEARCSNAAHVLWYDLDHCEAAGATCTDEPTCAFFNACSPPVCPLGGEPLEAGLDCPQDAGCYDVTNGNIPWTCVVGAPCSLGDEVVEVCPDDATCYTAQGEGDPVTCLDNDRASCSGDAALVAGGCIEQRFSGDCTEVTSDSGDVAYCVP